MSKLKAGKVGGAGYRVSMLFQTHQPAVSLKSSFTQLRSDLELTGQLPVHPSSVRREQGSE